MPLSPELDQNVRISFDELIASGNNIIQETRARDEHRVYSHTIEFQALLLKAASLIRMVLGNSERSRQLQVRLNVIEEDEWWVHDAERLVGILTALQHDYVNGYNIDLEEAILANVSSDYMSLAEALLGEGIPGKNDHVPAAVLCGAVLENRLRNYCEKRDPPLPTTKPNGDSKTLGALIEELDKVKAFDKQTRKMLRAWADIRNAAAHGRDNDFTREQVELMLLGVNGFLANQL